MLEAGDIQNDNLRDKVEKLNANKYLFCVRKGKNLEYFLIFSMKTLKIRKYLIINRNMCGFRLK